MGKLRLYIACTLDGFIASLDGGLEWLDKLADSEHNDYGFEEFYKTVDSIVMGGNTYREVIGFGIEWPYKDKLSYIITRNTKTKIVDKNIELIHADAVEVIKQVKADTTKDIWLVGGGEIISLMLDHKLIDDITLFIAPVVLGRGVLLFPNSPRERELKLNYCKNHLSGLVELNYDIMYPIDNKK
ncbi:MAG: dihydrofolate reductase family protein [Tannerellaceae bacterium]